MIVVTTPTGQIGSKLVPHLLTAGEAVRVIVRDPSKLAPDIRERVEIVTGSLDDEAVFQSALNMDSAAKRQRLATKMQNSANNITLTITFKSNYCLY
jgi:nucleoside-diphosphate-sugar epimerase